MRCSVPNCTNDTRKSTKSDGITYHLFPKEANLRLQWLQALNIINWEPKERSTICSEHFTDDNFYETKGGLRKIKSGAIPSDMEMKSEAELDAPAALSVCRICLAMDTKLYYLSEYNLNLMLEHITGIESKDRLPQRICWECAARLSAANRLRNTALTTNELLLDILRGCSYAPIAVLCDLYEFHRNDVTFFSYQALKIRDIKSIDRSAYNLQSRLKQKLFDNNDYDVHLEVSMVKSEDNQTSVDDCMEVDADEYGDETIDVKELPLTEIEVKDETSNEIFFQEYDNFDEDDDLALIEVCGKKIEEVKEVKPKVKVKRRRPKVKVVKKEKPKKIPEEEDTPDTASHRYKTSDVKRRRTAEAINENLFTITSLTYNQQIDEVMKRQESSNYINAPFKCTVCFRGFQMNDRYIAHSVRHSDQSGLYECFICKTRLKTSRALRKHLTAQHTEQYSCKGCPFVTRNRGVAREHERWHAGAKYQCPHCAAEFDKLTTYMGHIRIKHVSDFVCELCGYTFVSKKGIDVHKKKKHRLVDKNVELLGPYCAVCEVKFINDEAHDRHLKLSSRHSSDHDPNRIRNDSQSMHREGGGRRVERRPVIHAQHPDDARAMHEPHAPVNCEQCGIQLRDLRLYAQHFRRAHPDKNRTKYPAMKTPCMCEQCGRIFQSMALLKDHMWVHTGEKRFKCDRCTKSFTQKTNLVFHMRVHSATRPSYECPLCGKHFAFFNNRRRHMFIHTGLKPFKCDTCGKSFTTAGEQRAHVEHVHLKKPWPKRVRQRREWKGDPPALED